MGRSLPWFEREPKLDAEEDPSVMAEQGEDDLQSLVESKAQPLGPFKSAQHAVYMFFGLGAVICFMLSVASEPLTAGVSAMLAWLSWHTYWVHSARCRLRESLVKAQEKQTRTVTDNVPPRTRKQAAADQDLSELDMTGFAKSLGMQFDNSLPQSGTMTKVMMVTLVKEYLRCVTDLQKYQAKYGPLDDKGSVTVALPAALLAGLSMMPSDQPAVTQEQVNASPEVSARSNHQPESSRSASQADYESHADVNSQAPGSPPRSTSHSRQTSPDKPPRCAPSNNAVPGGHSLQEPTFVPEPRSNSQLPVAKDFGHAIAEAQGTPVGPPSRRADARSPMTNGMALGGPGGPGGPGLGAPSFGAGVPSLDGGMAPRRTEVSLAAPPKSQDKEEPWKPRCFRQSQSNQQEESEEVAKPQTSQYNGLFGQGPPPTREEPKPEPVKKQFHGLFGAR